MKDWIAIIEAAYQLDADLPSWLHLIAEAAAPILDRGHGTAVCAFQIEGGSLALEHLAFANGAADAADVTKRVLLESPAGVVDAIFRAGVPSGSLSDILGSTLDSDEVARANLTTGGRAIDGVGCVAHARGGAGLGILAPLAELGTMTRPERSRWRRIALHAGAAYRLRLALDSLSLDHGSVEAVLDPDGRVIDARGGAKAKTARAALQEAARRSERARGPTRRNDDEALALWEGLVRGRWSLVDQFDTDGRRFVVARPNDPRAKDPRGLADREVQTAELLGFGYTPKEIAYALGLAPSTVTNALSRARTKLGLRSQTELAAFFAPGGLRQRLIELELAGEPLAIGAIPLLEAEILARLTESERDVAVLLVQGSTNAEVARRRETTERTVANQVQSIYRKLGINSRAELGSTLRPEPG